MQSRIKNTDKTILAAIGRLYFFDNLSTAGFSEHAITNDAKNIIAISCIFITATKKINAAKLNNIFLAVIYFGNIFSNITPPIFNVVLCVEISTCKLNNKI